MRKEFSLPCPVSNLPLFRARGTFCRRSVNAFRQACTARYSCMSIVDSLTSSLTQPKHQIVQRDLEISKVSEDTIRAFIQTFLIPQVRWVAIQSTAGEACIARDWSHCTSLANRPAGSQCIITILPATPLYRKLSCFNYQLYQLMLVSSNAYCCCHSKSSFYSPVHEHQFMGMHDQIVAAGY